MFSKPETEDSPMSEAPYVSCSFLPLLECITMLKKHIKMMTLFTVSHAKILFDRQIVLNFWCSLYHIHRYNFLLYACMFFKHNSPVDCSQQYLYGHILKTHDKKSQNSRLLLLILNIPKSKRLTQSFNLINHSESPTDKVYDP